MVDKAVSVFGRLDISNAGFGTVPKPLHEQSVEDFDSMINLRGVFFCMKYEIQQMLTQEVIINNSSKGLIGIPGWVPYCEQT